ncbi:hypothetical protein BpHYR1_003309 [Brachionus plicatilis]|uniref:Uncharacterized protein n=1 Tax=Brachionus plicatilis TaxID=10195 RepID=A0A3M7SV84_BRAPC|nr:hypothetical protein BpHYR1_003309 [Brachionus plicatilis]
MTSLIMFNLLCKNLSTSMKVSQKHQTKKTMMHLY